MNTPNDTLNNHTTTTALDNFVFFLYSLRDPEITFFDQMNQAVVMYR